MVIESDRENRRHYEEQNQDAFVVRADYQEEKEADQQDDELGGDDVSENRAHKEAVFAFEKRHAVGAVMADVEWLVNNLRLATRRTAQSHRAPQDPLDLFQIYFQGVRIYYKRTTSQERAERDVSRKGAKTNRRRKDENSFRLCGSLRLGVKPVSNQVIDNPLDTILDQINIEVD